MGDGAAAPGRRGRGRRRGARPGRRSGSVGPAGRLPGRGLGRVCGGQRRRHRAGHPQAPRSAAPADAAGRRHRRRARRHCHLLGHGAAAGRRPAGASDSRGRPAILGAADRVADRLRAPARSGHAPAGPGGVPARRPRRGRHGRGCRLLRPAHRRRLRRLGLRPGRHRPLQPTRGPAPVHHRPQRRRPGGHPRADRRRPAGPHRPLLGCPGRGQLSGCPPRPCRPCGVLLPGRAGPGGGRRQRRPGAQPADQEPAVQPVPAVGPTAGAAGLHPAAGQPPSGACLCGGRRDGRPQRPGLQRGPGRHPTATAWGRAGAARAGLLRRPVPQSAAARPWADPRPALARLATPALVIKGSCDYLSWGSAVHYRQALPNAELVYLQRAGHNTYQDQPAAFLASVRAFLTGRPLPIAPQSGTGVPADYEGPDGHLLVPGRQSANRPAPASGHGAGGDPVPPRKSTT